MLQVWPSKDKRPNTKEKDKEGTTERWVGGIESQYHQIPPPWGGRVTNRRMITTSEALSKE